MIKCAIFDKLSDFSRFNFGVINFDKKTHMENIGCNSNINSTKFLYVQSNEAVSPYFMMGILPNNGDTSKFAIETLIAPTFNTRSFFYNQEVTIPTQILITTCDKMDKLEASPAEKIALLNQYRSIINEYNLPNRLNIYGDYESLLVEQSRTKTRKLV